MQEGIALDPESRIGWLRANLLIAYVQEERWLSAREHILSVIGDSDPRLHDAIVRTWPPVDVPPAGFDAGLLNGSRWLDASGTLWMALGRPERALERVEELCDGPPFGLTYWLFNPAYDPLRDDPRFLEILETRGLKGRRPIRSRDLAEAGA